MNQRPRLTPNTVLYNIELSGMHPISIEYEQVT